MTPEQRDLLVKAQESLEAARLLRHTGHFAFAASRAYYSMFYVAEAFLAGKGLSLSKHGGVHGAFAQHFGRTGLVPKEYQRHLVRGMEVRHVADYGNSKQVTAEEADEQINHAADFLALAERQIGPLPPSGET